MEKGKEVGKNGVTTIEIDIVLTYCLENKLVSWLLVTRVSSFEENKPTYCSIIFKNK
jgi:hypothetical protein